jgi:hypothetical protein
MNRARMISLGLLLASATAAIANSARLDLAGTVLRENGSPITNALIFVYTAQPKVGSAVVCPSCYADCGKRVRTSVDGTFVIPSLDPGLRFKLLVIAAGFESQFVSRVDPEDGNTKITLAALSEAKLNSPTRIKGMIMDPEGKPLAGAVISPEGVAFGAGTHWGGTERYVDPLGVTDELGRFVMFCTNNVDRVHAIVEGRNVAKRWVELTPGRDHLVRMNEGVAISGRIQKEGKPAATVELGLVTRDRTCGNFIKGDELATDERGYFLMANVPPKTELVLYAKMTSVPDAGRVDTRTITTGAAGTRLDVGILEVKPAHRIAGRVVLSDAEPIPPDTRLFLGREDAWDHVETTLDSKGHFEFKGVPLESVGLNIRVPGYKFSKRNPNLDWLNGGLVGRVDGDILDLTILMEPGTWRHNGDEGEPPGGESQPRNKPLRGPKL